LFPSPALPYSSSRTVGFVRRSWAGILGSDNPMSPISFAPHKHNAFHEPCLSRLRGRVLIHRICSTRHQTFHRRKLLRVVGPGAAVSHALSRQARSRVHAKSDRLHPGPEVVCNKNRFGSYKMRARRPSPVGRSQPALGPGGEGKSEHRQLM